MSNVLLLDNSYGNNNGLEVDEADGFSWDQLLLDNDSDVEMIE